MRKKWIVLCHRADKFNPSNSYICSDHFLVTDFERDMRNELLGLPVRRRLIENAVPSLKIKPERTSAMANERSQRMQVKEQKEVQKRCLENAMQFAESTSSAASSDERNEALPTELNSEPDYKQLYHELQQHCIKVETELALKNIELDNFRKTQMLEKREKPKLKAVIEELNSCKMQLKKAEKLSKSRLRSLRQEANKALQTIFTQNQIKILTGKQKYVHWTNDEISNAFTLRYLSRKAYIFVRNKLQYPLPGVSSLRRWAKTIEMRHGFLSSIIIEVAGENLDNFQRLTVLSFDEIKVEKTLEYDAINDEIVGPFSQMQIVMARGLNGKWKQPVFVDFDQKITQQILNNIISALNDINYKVVACVSDCGGGNLGLVKNLGLTYENPQFQLPGIAWNIVYFPDAPHLLKLIRNWLLDTGFILGNGQKISREPLDVLVDVTSSELNICHKINNSHINCEGSQRQNVRMAAQLLSNNTAKALLHLQPGTDKELCKNTAYFIQLVSDWFEMMNVYHPAKGMTSPSFKSGYGQDLENQNKLLNEFYEAIKNMRCISKARLQIFQKGILMSINALKCLLENVKEFGMTYILTSKLNQDALENLFSQIRSRGGLNDHPSPLNALYRLRMIILGKNTGLVHVNANTEDINQEEFILGSAFKSANIETEDEGTELLSNKLNSISDFHESSETDTASETLSSPTNDSSPAAETSEDALMYLAGWIARKFKVRYPDLGQITGNQVTDHDYAPPPWIAHLSYGGLTMPSENFKYQILRLEMMLKKLWKNEIPKCKVIQGTVRKLVEKMEGEGLGRDVIEAFVKHRMFIRMKYKNMNEKNLKMKQKFKKLSKFRKCMI